VHERHKGHHTQHLQVTVVDPNGKGIYLTCAVNSTELDLHGVGAAAVPAHKLFVVRAKLGVHWVNLDVAREERRKHSFNMFGMRSQKVGTKHVQENEKPTEDESRHESFFGHFKSFKSGNMRFWHLVRY